MDDQARGLRDEMERREREHELLTGTLIGPDEREARRALRRHDLRVVIVWLLIACAAFAAAWTCAVREADQPRAATDERPAAGAATYTITAGDPASIHGFLLWLGLTRTAPPEAVAQRCMMQGLVPLGAYQRADGMSGPMCFSPYEQIDPATCANWGAERIAMTERTITCGRQGA